MLTLIQECWCGLHDPEITPGLNLWVSSLEGCPGGSDGKEFACSAGDHGSIPG